MVNHSDYDHVEVQTNADKEPQDSPFTSDLVKVEHLDEGVEKNMQRLNK